MDSERFELCADQISRIFDYDDYIGACGACCPTCPCIYAVVM